jgi:bilirubin oxidase
VPLVSHLHGGHTFDDSDGYPEAWFLPAANDIPAGYATRGTWYNFFRRRRRRLGAAVGTRHGDLRLLERSAGDDAVGSTTTRSACTRANVYAGLAAFYLLRGGDDAIARSCRIMKCRS